MSPPGGAETHEPEYLTEVFFGREDFSDPSKVTRATRHAVAHGVASDDLLDERAAVLGVLLLQQLAYLLPGDVLTETPAPDESGK